MTSDTTSSETPTPWWAKNVSAFYLTIGPSTLVLVVFLGMFTGWIDSPLLEARDLIRKNQTYLVDHLNTMYQDHHAQTQFLWAICMNTAGADRSAADRCQRVMAQQSISQKRSYP